MCILPIQKSPSEYARQEATATIGEETQSYLRLGKVRIDDDEGSRNGGQNGVEGSVENAVDEEERGKLWCGEKFKNTESPVADSTMVVL